MKTISMHELISGDIFCKVIKLKNREEFKVLEAKDNVLLCVSRNEIVQNAKAVRKSITEDPVIYLRHEPVTIQESNLL